MLAGEPTARMAQRLAVVVDRHSQWWITRNVLSAYLGERTGPKVLAGQIRRGTGVELTGVELTGVENELAAAGAGMRKIPNYGSRLRLRRYGVAR
jgi:hypothetical protein